MVKNEHKELDERIGDVAQKWFLMEPLLFAAYCTHMTEGNHTLKIPMRCGDGKIEYNPDLLSGVSDAELADHLKVEAIRILLKHPYIRKPQGARSEILYLASNMTILDSMGGPEQFVIRLLPRWLYNMLPHGGTFEGYYHLLDGLFPPPTPQEPTLNDSSSDSLVDDINTRDLFAGLNSSQPRVVSIKPMLPYATEATSLWEEDALMIADINLQIEQTMNSCTGRGTMPASFVESVKASIVARFNVAWLLSNFKTNVMKQQRNLTRMRPSRRYGFDQMGSRYAFHTKILVAIDVSGSVSSNMLSDMIGMINRIFKEGNVTVDFVQFDADLKLPVIPMKKVMKTLKVIGRGGTNFQPATDYYLSHEEYDGLLFVTDGCAPNPSVSQKEMKTRPVAWIILDDRNVQFKKGWKRS